MRKKVETSIRKHKVSESTLTNTSNTFQVNNNKHDRQVCESTNNNVYTNNNIVAIEFSIKRKLEYSTSRTFVRLFLQNYKRARQSRLQAVRIQSALCEVACEGNSLGLKNAIVKIYRTVVSAYENRSLKKYSELYKLLLYYQV